MRTTMQTIHNSILANLNKTTTDMFRLNNQISSGKRINKISDDPVALVSALGLRTNLTEIDQYRKNLQHGDTMIAAAESSLTQIKSLVIDAKVLALKEINAPISSQIREDSAEEAKGYFDTAITLANSSVNNKYIFGGYRTTGYTTEEPAPFIADLVDGYRITGSNITTTDAWLTSTVTNTAIAAGDLEINGNAIGAIAAGAVTGGLNMEKALNARNAIEAADATVNVNLTTLTYSSAATVDATGTDTIDITINGTAISVSVTNGQTLATVNANFVAAVNAQTALTGVTADIGDGTNGAAANTLILKNAQTGDETAIDITAFSAGTTGTNINFAVAAQTADTTHNTGQISVSSTSSFEFTSPNDADDAILTELGLDGGGLGFSDVDNDGELIYGSSMAAGDLKINGLSIGATADDGNSTIYADVSADAKATAINLLESTTGVSAVVTPAYRQASGATIAGTINSGDLIINGVDIFDGSATTNADPSTIIAQDTDNTLIDAINAKQGTTGIAASRDSDGIIILKAIDGRNLHIQTTANGENITHLNGAAADTPASKVYFGSIQLRSDTEFTLETTPVGTLPNIYEPGLAAIGLDGGVVSTGESGDTADDGKLTVKSIVQLDGNVRYAGDRENDIAVKIGQSSTLTISKNGQDAIKDTGVFTVLKSLEDTLRAQKYTTVTSVYQATDTTATLDSEDTGLEQEFNPFSDGAITITVTDHAQYPTQDFTMTVSVDVSEDSLTSVASKINGIPGMTATWDSNGYLTMATTDSSRYTFTFDDSSNFLELNGITPEEQQLQALEQSISDLDTLMNDLTSQISDFGSRANRIQVQNQIYDNLELATTESLSEKEDTDIIEALMELKNKEVTYEAALNAAAKTMQLSLVNFL